MTLTVSEVFGPTVQGEGPTAGRLCGFVRLGRCNLDCGSGPGSTWACDTPFTWDWSGRIGPAQDPGALYRVEDPRVIVDQLRAMGVHRCVISGGEPLLQERGLEDLTVELRLASMDVEVETNGTRVPSGLLAARVDRFNVSPKLANSGVEFARRIVPEALAALRLTGKAVFKFVCSGQRDLEEVGRLVAEHHLGPVWIMPAGTTAASVLETTQALADPVIERGWNLTTRLHVLVWGDRRGV